MTDELTPASSAPQLLDHESSRARSRPRAVALVWLWELVSALVLATPIHAWAMRTWGAHPDGDSVLFRAGGASLLTWLAGGSAASPLAIVSRSTLVDFVLVLVFGQFVVGALIASLATGISESARTPPLSYALRVGFSSFTPLLGTTLLFGSLQIFLVGLGILISSAAARTFGDGQALVARVVVLALFGIVVLLVGVVGDLTRVAIVRTVAANGADKALRQGVISALRTSREAFVRASLGWGWRAAVSVALLFLAWAASGPLDNSRSLLWVLWIVHQGIAFARVAMRASWLARALRLVGRYGVT